MKHRKHPKSGRSVGSPLPNGASKVRESATAERAQATPHDAAAPMKAARSAFDVWLERGLHKLYDDVANEPIPSDLLQLIEDDRRKDEEDKAT